MDPFQQSLRSIDNMISFFVIPYRPEEWEHAKSDLRILPDTYGESLRNRWPDIRVYLPPDDSPYALRWETKGRAGEIVEGGLQRDLQTVAITPASKSVLSEFVLWHRNQVPKQYRLFMTRENSTDSLELRAETNEQEIDEFSQLVA
ncbi:MAG TPA: hypothetical protein VJK02_22990 [Anaerolineales bacterium]|nr:hypothetical protein [Anaerolineales bacterium]